MERQLVAEELHELRVRLDGLLVLPGLGDRLSVVQRVERGPNVGVESGARITSGRDHVSGRRAELGGVVRRDDRTERMAEQGEAVELERLGQQVDVAGEDLERERGGIDPLRAPLPALVDVEHAVLVAERVEVRPEHRVVESWSAVQPYQRKAAADLLDVEVLAVRQRELHARTLCRSGPVWGQTPASGRSGLGFVPV